MWESENSSHYGGRRLLFVARPRGLVLIGLSMSNDIPSVAAPGFAWCPSPEAIRCPTPCPPGKTPYGWALGYVHCQPWPVGKGLCGRGTRGESIPGNWLIGADGTSDHRSERFISGGGAPCSPPAAHKGYGCWAFADRKRSRACSRAAGSHPAGGKLALGRFRPDPPTTAPLLSSSMSVRWRLWRIFVRTDPKHWWTKIPTAPPAAGRTEWDQIRVAGGNRKWGKNWPGLKSRASRFPPM